MKYERFMVFELIAYYPAGGLGDCKHSFDNLNEAKAYIEKENEDPGNISVGYEIFDRIKGEIVE